MGSGMSSRSRQKKLNSVAPFGGPVTEAIEVSSIMDSESERGESGRGLRSSGCTGVTFNVGSTGSSATRVYPSDDGAASHPLGRLSLALSEGDPEYYDKYKYPRFREGWQGEHMRCTGLDALAKAFYQRGSLVFLNLKEDEFTSRSGIFALSEVADALKSNGPLCSIDLGGNAIGPEGARVLAEGIRHNKPLLFLQLGGNKIEDAGVEALASALHENQTLGFLDLKDNGIGAAGAASLGRALEVNPGLVSLDLTGNSIGDEGAVAVARGVVASKSLAALDLGRNSIGDVGAMALAQALEASESLAMLDVRQNTISNKGSTAIMEAVLVSKALEELNLAGNKQTVVSRWIMGRGPRSMVKYLREAGKTSKMGGKASATSSSFGWPTIPKMKVMLVGRAGCGRTALGEVLQRGQGPHGDEKHRLIDVTEVKVDGGVITGTMLTSKHTLYVVATDLSYTHPPPGWSGSSDVPDPNGGWGEEQELDILRQLVASLVGKVPGCTIALVGTRADAVSPPEEAKKRLRKAEDLMELTMRAHVSDLEWTKRDLDELVAQAARGAAARGEAEKLRDQLRAVNGRLLKPASLCGALLSSQPEVGGAGGMRRKVLEISQAVQPTPESH